jgi:hypothetical protein
MTKDQLIAELEKLRITENRYRMKWTPLSRQPFSKIR